MNITFKDLYKKMEDRVNNTITQEEFYDYLDNNIDIEKYLPISKKYAVAEIVSKKYEASLILQSEIKNFDSFIYMQYDIYKTLYSVFVYTSIIINKEFYNQESYDLCYKSGLIQYIKKESNNDLDSLFEKCDCVSGINNIFIIKKLNETLSVNTVEDWEKIEDIINNGIDENKLKFFNEITAYNDPHMHELFDKIKENSVKRVKGKKSSEKK